MSILNIVLECSRIPRAAMAWGGTKWDSNVFDLGGWHLIKDIHFRCAPPHLVTAKLHRVWGLPPKFLRCEGATARRKVICTSEWKQINLAIRLHEWRACCTNPVWFGHLDIRVVHGQVLECILCGAQSVSSCQIQEPSMRAAHLLPQGPRTGCRRQLLTHLKFGIVTLGMDPAPLVLVDRIGTLVVGGTESAIIQHVAIPHKAALCGESGQRDRAGPLVHQVGDGNGCVRSVRHVSIHHSQSTKRCPTLSLCLPPPPPPPSPSLTVKDSTQKERNVASGGPESYLQAGPPNMRKRSQRHAS